MAKSKPTYLQKRSKNEPNKKAIIWAGAGLGIIAALMTVLLIINH